MIWIVIVLVLALGSQIGLFIYSRKIKKKIKASVVSKYNLKTPKDAWNALASQDIPEEDKVEIRKLYEGRE